MHARQQLVNITTPEMTREDIGRYFSKVDMSGGLDACWPWQASKFHFGHGQFTFTTRGKKRRLKASRVAFLLETGEWPSLCVLHRCDNPSCCNPGHLFLGTKADNNRDRYAKDRYQNAPKGEDCTNSKLTSDIVLKIRNSDLSRKQLAAMYGVSESSIGRAIRRECWATV